MAGRVDTTLPADQAKLAALAVDDVLGRNTGDLVDQPALVDYIATALAAFVASDAAADEVVHRVESFFDALADPK